MKLIYTDSGKPVQLGDRVTLDGKALYVIHFAKPRSPASEGKVTVAPKKNDAFGREYYASIIGAEWIEREDRAD